jgi:hypothetical protein
MRHSKQLIDRFEKERWLYEDGSLSDERKSYWDKMISKEPELSKMLDEINNFSNAADSFRSYDLSEEKLDAMIAVARNKFSDRINPPEDKDGDSNLSSIYYKITFAGAAAAVVIISLLLFSLVGKKQKLENSSNDWEDKAISEQIHLIDSSIDFIANEDLRDELLRRINSDWWFKEVYLINDKILQIKNELKENKL